MRILLVADTHIGFDLPLKPRITRRRRGHDFLANFRRALEPARQGQVDLVVHGGDLLFRSLVPPGTVEMAMEPLVEIASAGVPVYLVPGNHERSKIPLHLWAGHPEIHIFDRPRTYRRQVGGQSIALSGFPYVRDIRQRFQSVVEASGYRPASADVSILCMHQAVEGARVGPGHFTFSSGRDVVRGRDIDAGLDAVFTGHIHRAQCLRRDRTGQALAAPVIYPGSVERTSWAERDEPKGYCIVTIDKTTDPSPDLQWVKLPARPMVDVKVTSAPQREALEASLRSQLSQLQDDAVVRVHLEGAWSKGAQMALAAQNLRRLAPATMNISLHPQSAA
ncbi:MAG: DNA repair exonuclease [Gemmatimonadetes bacterium]|nr:DNA repair exonuclease [Gemmatimonadota bacterium]